MNPDVDIFVTVPLTVPLHVQTYVPSKRMPVGLAPKVQVPLWIDQVALTTPVAAMTWLTVESV